MSKVAPFLKKKKQCVSILPEMILPNNVNLEEGNAQNRTYALTLTFNSTKFFAKYVIYMAISMRVH